MQTTGCKLTFWTKRQWKLWSISWTEQNKTPCLGKCNRPLSFSYQPNKRLFTFSRCSAKNLGSSQRTSCARQRVWNQCTIQLNWKHLFSMEIVCLKRRFCGKFYLVWGEIKIFNFWQTGTLQIKGFWSVPVDLRLCIYDCEAICDHLCYRWMIDCPPRLEDVRWSVFLPNVVKTCHKKCATAVSVVLEWKAFSDLSQKTVVSWGSHCREKFLLLQIIIPGLKSFWWTRVLNYISAEKNEKSFPFSSHGRWYHRNGEWAHNSCSAGFMISKYFGPKTWTTWRRIIHPKKRDIFVCQMSHWSPSMRAAASALLVLFRKYVCTRLNSANNDCMANWILVNCVKSPPHTTFCRQQFSSLITVWPLISWPLRDVSFRIFGMKLRSPVSPHSPWNIIS